MVDPPKAASDVQSVWTTRFSRILEKHSMPANIDFLSLDVEGAEEAIMRAFPFDRHNVTTITIERPSKALRELLYRRDYKVFCAPGYLDEIWVHWPTVSRTGAEWARHAGGKSLPPPVRKGGKILPNDVTGNACDCKFIVFPSAPECRTAKAAVGRHYRTKGVLAGGG